MESEEQNRSIDVLRSGMAELAALADAVRADPESGGRLESDPRGLLAEHGITVPHGIEVRMAVNTAETFHLVLPPDPNTAIADEELSSVAGGIMFTCVGSQGSATTASTASGTVSTASSAGSFDTSPYV